MRTREHCQSPAWSPADSRRADSCHGRQKQTSRWSNEGLRSCSGTPSAHRPALKWDTTSVGWTNFGLMCMSSPPVYMQLECTIRFFYRDKAIFFLSAILIHTDSFVLCGLIRYSKSSGFICYPSSPKINIFINSHLVESIINKSGLNKSVNIQNSAESRGRALLYAVSRMICMKNGNNISCQTVICAWRRSWLATQTSIVGWKCERYCCAGLNKTENISILMWKTLGTLANLTVLGCWGVLPL